MRVKREIRDDGRRRRRSRRTAKGRPAVVVLAVGLLFALQARASAHEGPPYPLFVDKNVGPYLVSVWADPDVGAGTFFVAAEAARGGAPADDLAVEVCVRPAGGRLGEECYAARREGVRDRAQFKTEVPFDRQELWHTRVRLRSSLGVGEAAADVEATPPGLGRWDLLLYLSPFAAVGLLWLRAALKG
ncbi:MAG: hypothetical protein ACJ74Q_02785 [Pyrinomonadaceae bacterium]